MKIQSLYRLLAFSRSESELAIKDYVKDARLKYPIDVNFNEILEYFHNTKSVVVYRGLNFYTKEDYDSFIDSIKSGYLTESNITSWSTSKAVAEKYAKVRQFDLSVFTFDMKTALDLALSTRTKNDVIGFRGVILKTIIQPNSGIDVSSINSSEHEVILPAGSYKVSYENVLSYNDKYSIKEADKILKELDKKDFNDVFIWLQQKGIKPKDLSDETKHKIYLYTADKLEDVKFGVDIKKSDASVDEFTKSLDERTIIVYCTGLPNAGFEKWFTSKDSKELADYYRPYIASILSDFISALNSSSSFITIVFYSNLKYWAEATGNLPKLSKAIILMKEKLKQLKLLHQIAQNDVKKNGMWNSKYTPAIMLKLSESIERLSNQITYLS